MVHMHTVLFHIDVTLRLLRPFADLQINTIVTTKNAGKSSLLGRVNAVALDRSLGFNLGRVKPQTSKLQFTA